MSDIRSAAPPQWRTSTRSGQNNQCVAVADNGATTLVRDTKNADGGPTISFTTAQWDVFLREVTEGLPSDNGVVGLSTGALNINYPHVGSVVTTWHLRSLDTTDVLHFNDDEWEAFRLGAADGEFTSRISAHDGLSRCDQSASLR